MKWRGGRRSSNIDDRRASSGGGRRSGIRLPFPTGGRGGGGKMGGLTLVIIIVGALIFGVDPMQLLGGLTGGGGAIQTSPQSSQPLSAQDKEMGEFVAVVLADTEDTWNKIFSAAGRDYKEPKLVMFRGAVNTACGSASSAVGPFYCPGDQQVYIDLSFFDDLHRRFGAPGDFAQAYVIAHEVGHHVQTILGISRQVQQQKARMSKTEGNAVQVKMELQADCFSGLWAHNIRNSQNVSLEAGDIDEALRAANAIGDDTLQRKSTGQVVPDSFTHGSSAQRKRWFMIGYEGGDFARCDTFSAPRL